MAFNSATFVQASANPGNSAGPRIHTYRSEDAHGDIDASGYFDDIADLLKIGDLIYHVEVTDIGVAAEAITDAQWFVVLTISAAGVVVSSIETEIVVTTG